MCTPERRREISKRGGLASAKSPKHHKFTVEELRKGAQKGGQILSKNREHMSQIGKKGGASHSREHMSQIGKKGGASHSPEHFRTIGRKGGLAVSSDREHMQAIGQKGGRMRRRDTIPCPPPETE
jgi:uncharacterized protein